MDITLPFAFGARVNIDSDRSLAVIVTGFQTRCIGQLQVECSWVIDGSLHYDWIESTRLKIAE